MNMREKIARALLATDYPEDAGGEMENLWWDRHGDHYLAQADAVLDVIAEPTQEMIEAGADGSGEDSASAALGAWEAMIQAAKEGK